MPTAAKAQKAKPETPQVDVTDVPADRPESAELATTIQRANTLIEQKQEVLASLQQARELATLLIANGSGSREQVAWVRQYLPRKQRKTNGNGAE
jgi:hypothetical protein